ncbi:MucR family transcriptional regulator [Martelella alba]|uniref:MucR family transcriptional regulator n=1 Tax=Martelella alba TaxID=2590451 RepID=A0A506U9X4_9HYPH|nr:MucR family transcriptional regulator [Martelella alba]TPW30156.1 MucR family transcriptional regulator [Martelella alba]
MYSKIQDPMPENISSLTANIVTAYISRNDVSADELPALIASVQRALGQPDQAGQSSHGETWSQPNSGQTPAVPVAQSLENDYIICLEDGRRFRSLKRHLKSQYNMTPDEYRIKWGLPPEYPMVAPSYAARRSHIAKDIGLGVTVSKRTPKLEDKS